MNVLRLEPGVYRVTHDADRALVYVATSETQWWAFWNGEVYDGMRDRSPASEPVARRAGHAHEPIAAPMPATVLKILVAPGDRVRKGDTVAVVEAMKMELPLRAPADGVVTAVHCREGELVQPEVVLVEVESA